MFSTSRRSLRVESLESRRLMAAGVSNSCRPADSNRPVIDVDLSVAAEVAPFVGLDGTGAGGEVTLKVAGKNVFVDAVFDGTEPALFHIHKASVGENGPVVVDLTATLDGDEADGKVKIDLALAQDILTNPGDYYFNTHEGLPGTDDFFRSIRGQLESDRVTDRKSEITLTTEEEVAPFVGLDGTDASGQVSIKIAGRNVFIEANFEGTQPALFHIHKAPAGQNGGVVVDLTSTLDGDEASGRVKIDLDLANDILPNPELYSFNTHEGLPGSEAFFRSVRGQLG